MKKLLMGCAAVVLTCGVAAAQTNPTTGPATPTDPQQGNAGMHEPTVGTVGKAKGNEPAVPQAETTAASPSRHEGAAGTGGNELKGPPMTTGYAGTTPASPVPHESAGTGTSSSPSITTVR